MSDKYEVYEYGAGYTRVLKNDILLTDFDLVEDIKKLQAENAELKKQSQWVSVEDARPKYGQKCNVYLNGALMDGVYFFDGADDCDDWFEPITENKSNGFFVFANEIEWCALPTPPEGD